MSIGDTLESAARGVPLAESVYDAAEAVFADQNPISAAGNVFSGVAAVGDIVQDPVGTFFASGVGWIFEHVPVLKSSLDAVSGNPDAIDTLTESWTENVATPLAAVSADVKDAGSATAPGWAGVDADAYREATSRLAVSSDALGQASRAAASSLAFAGTLVTEVRNFIRDELAELCVWAVATVAAGAAAAVPSGGASVVAATNTIVLRAVMLGQKFVRVLRTLSGKLQSLSGKLGALGDAAKALRAASARIDGAATATARAVDDGALVRATFEPRGDGPVDRRERDLLIDGAIGGYKAAGDAWAAGQESKPA